MSKLLISANELRIAMMSFSEPSLLKVKRLADIPNELKAVRNNVDARTIESV